MMDRKGFLGSLLASFAALPVFPTGRHRDPEPERESLRRATYYDDFDEADWQAARLEALRRSAPLRITSIIENRDGEVIYRKTKELKSRRQR